MGLVDKVRVLFEVDSLWRGRWRNDRCLRLNVYDRAGDVGWDFLEGLVIVRGILSWVKCGWAGVSSLDGVFASVDNNAVFNDSVVFGEIN